jgi:hypothetical protein
MQQAAAARLCSSHLPVPHTPYSPHPLHPEQIARLCSRTATPLHQAATTRPKLGLLTPVLCLALSYVCAPPAEREVMEACVRQLESPSLSAGVRDLLAPLVTLFAAASVERELSWYLAQEVVPVKVSCTEVAGCCGMVFQAAHVSVCSRVCLARRWCL